MDHSRISDEDWEHVRYLNPNTAYVDKVWLDNQGNIHVEVIHDVSQKETALEGQRKLDELKQRLKSQATEEYSRLYRETREKMKSLVETPSKFTYGPEVQEGWVSVVDQSDKISGQN